MLEGNNFVIVNDGTSKFFQCLKCPFKSEEGPEFLEHVIRCKGVPQKVVVTETIELPDSPPRIAQKEEEERVQFSCVLCPKKFPKREELQEHLKNHWPYKCRVCDGKFKTQIAQRSHEFRFHNPEYNSHSTECKNCTQKFVRPWDLFVHLTNVHFTNGMIQCTICTKLFTTDSALEDHCKESHPDEPSTDASKKLEGSSSKKDENSISQRSIATVELSNEDINLLCEEIKSPDHVPAKINQDPVKIVSRKDEGIDAAPTKVADSDDTLVAGSLLVPISSGVVKKSFYCNDCPQVFDNSRDYKKHARAHRPYKCKVCKKAFKTEHFFRVHELSEHNPEYDANSKNCKSCSEEFEESIELFFHLIRDHGIVKLAYKCALCNKSFEFERNFELHMTQAHKHESNKDKKS